MDKIAEDLKARTKRFAARLGIVLEEADEAELWLDVCQDRRLGDATRRDCLLSESRELRAIFSTACRTARAKYR